MKGYIYKLRSEETGEEYVGSTFTSIGTRFTRHKCTSRHTMSKLYDAMRVSKFVAEKLEEIEAVDTQTLRSKEQEWIERISPTLNHRRAFRTDEQARQQVLDAKKRYRSKAVECPACGKAMKQGSLHQHQKICGK